MRNLSNLGINLHDGSDCAMLLRHIKIWVGREYEPNLQSTKRSCIKSVLCKQGVEGIQLSRLVLSCASDRRFLPGSGFPAWVPTQPDLGPGPDHRPRTSPHRTGHQASSCLPLQCILCQPKFVSLKCNLYFQKTTISALPTEHPCLLSFT